MVREENYIVRLTIRAILAAGALLISACVLYYGLAAERDAFNKFKSADTPAATIKDALFSELRIESR